MLYDPKWEKTETKTDPFSLGSLIAWLEKQPRATPYNYDCNGGCLLAQYFTAMGLHRVSVGGSFMFHGNLPQEVHLSKNFRTVALGYTVHGPHTFGAALDRARALTER
jgi:hypothetical protein